MIVSLGKLRSEDNTKIDIKNFVMKRI